MDTVDALLYVVIQIVVAFDGRYLFIWLAQNCTLLADVLLP